MTLRLSSPAFSDGSPIPREFTCEGADRSPALRWSGLPEGTRSLALTVVDPDAPRGEFTHWVLFDIPASVTELPEGAGDRLGVPGTNDFGRIGYGGPCPPPGHGRHRYIFTLYALDTERLGLPRGARRVELERALQGHVLAQAQLTGTYERR